MGTWMESIGDGKTFNCGGVFIVSGSSDAVFGSICPFASPTTSPITTSKPTTMAPSTTAPTLRFESINAISPTFSPSENSGQVLEGEQAQKEQEDEGDIAIGGVIINVNDYLYFIIAIVAMCCICGIFL